MKILRVLAQGDLPDRILVEATSRCLEASGHTVRVVEVPAATATARGMRFGPVPPAELWERDGPWDIIELPQDCIGGLDRIQAPAPVVVRATRLLGSEWEYRVRTGGNRNLLPGWWERFRFPGKVLRPWSDALRASRAVFCTTDRDKAYLENQVRYPAARIHLVGSGTDADHFACGEHRLSSGTIPRLLWMGPWTARRGSETVAQAFAVLRKEMPQIRLRISDPDADPDAVRATFDPADRDGIEVDTDPSASVRCGQYTQHDILVAVAPSESFDPTVLEAAAAGMALVLGDQSGAEPGLDAGTDFLSVPENDPQALAAAVCRLIDDPDLTTRLRFAAVAKARTFPWSAVAQRFESGYKQAIEPV